MCGAGGEALDQGWRGWDSELNWTEMQSGLCRGFCPSFRKCQGLVVLLRTLLPAPGFLIYDYGLCHLSVGPKSPELSRALIHSLPLYLSFSVSSSPSLLLQSVCTRALRLLWAYALGFSFLIVEPPLQLPLLPVLPCFALLLDWAIT